MQILTHPDDQEIADVLRRWGRSCNGNYLPLTFWVGCTSLESEYLPPAGQVYAGIEALLRASMPKRMGDMGKVDVAVMRLPERIRTALALEFVVHKRMPITKKLRILRAHCDEYFFLVRSGARIVKVQIGLDKPVKEEYIVTSLG